MTDTTKKPSGFAAMTPEQRLDMARKGQAALKARGTRYKFTPEAARAAALKARDARNARLASVQQSAAA